MTSDSDTRIQERAYAIWEAEGRPHGKHDEHWHRAAEEIARESEVDGLRPASGSTPAAGGNSPGLRSHRVAPPADGAKPGTPAEPAKGEAARRTRRGAPASS